MNFLREIGPLLVFFIVYKFYNISIATASLMIVMLLIVAYDYFIKKQLSKSLLISTAILLVCGGVTVITGDSKFIKIKLTIVNLVFAAILLVGTVMKNGLIKHILSTAFSMSEESWVVLSRRFGLYFLFIAILNEVVWRNFSDAFWVNFKIFGTSTITILFIISQVSFLNKYGVMVNEK
jgi:intracellular septation protein